jgi:hypothetical protein
MTARRRHKKYRVLKAELQTLLAQPLDDADLRQRLEELASEGRFGDLADLWAPVLYQHNRIFFRPFIRAHFVAWRLPMWRGEAGRRLTAWMEATEQHDDRELFQPLYNAYLESRPWEWLLGRSAAWCPDLLRRFREAPTASRRDRVLGWCDQPGVPLNESTALALYDIDSGPTTVAFLLQHLPASTRRLQAAVRRHGLDSFYWDLYRRNVTDREWRQEVFRLAREVADPAHLVNELRLRHPARHVRGLGRVLEQLIEQRGRDVVDYVIGCQSLAARDLWGGWYPGLLDLAQRRGWSDLWAALLTTHGRQGEYERALLGVIEDPQLGDEQALQQLSSLWHSHSRRHPGDRTLVRLYRRFPDLVRNQLLANPGALPWLGLPRLQKAALEAGDDRLWAGLVRSGWSNRAYEKVILSLLQDPDLPEEVARRRLAFLSGVNREWNAPGFGLAQVRVLSDRTASALYRRFPDLVRGPYRKHASPGWSGAYPLLTAAALEAHDEEMIDYLASRLLTQRWLHRKMRAGVEQVSRHYEALLPGPANFVRRAVAVLGQVPAFVLGNREYNELIRVNRLARLLFERTSALHVDEPRLLRDLLEAPEIHVQVLALRVLAIDDPRVGPIAADNLELLLPCLLRRLHRRTRLLAFAALANAAVREDIARRILERCRQALDLPEKHYPREQLIGLIGQLLHRWPALRGSREQPTVYSGERH